MQLLHLPQGAPHSPSPRSPESPSPRGLQRDPGCGLGAPKPRSRGGTASEMGFGIADLHCWWPGLLPSPPVGGSRGQLRPPLLDGLGGGGLFGRGTHSEQGAKAGGVGMDGGTALPQRIGGGLHKWELPPSSPRSAQAPLRPLEVRGLRRKGGGSPGPHSPHPCPTDLSGPPRWPWPLLQSDCGHPAPPHLFLGCQGTPGSVWKELCAQGLVLRAGEQRGGAGITFTQHPLAPSTLSSPPGHP